MITATELYAPNLVEREYYGDILNRTEAYYRRWGVWKGTD